MTALDGFETARLIAERPGSAHLDELCRMHRDGAVMATLGGLRSDQQTRADLAGYLEHWERHGWGLWMLRERDGGRFVGRAGLRRVHVGGNDEVELAYALCAEFWNQGLATEISRALLALAFGPLQLPNLVALTLPTNRASCRVMEKLGLRYERDFVHAGLPHVLYRLCAAPR